MKVSRNFADPTAGRSAHKGMLSILTSSCQQNLITFPGNSRELTLRTCDFFPTSVQVGVGFFFPRWKIVSVNDQNGSWIYLLFIIKFTGEQRGGRYSTEPDCRLAEHLYSNPGMASDPEAYNWQAGKCRKKRPHSIFLVSCGCGKNDDFVNSPPPPQLTQIVQPGMQNSAVDIE